MKTTMEFAMDQKQTKKNTKCAAKSENNWTTQ